jgi:hypothetical protein
MKFWNPCYRSENKKSSLLLRLCFYNFQQLNSYPEINAGERFIPLIRSLNRQNLAFKTHEIIDHIIYYLRNAAVKIESIDVAETIKATKALIETEV